MAFHAMERDELNQEVSPEKRRLRAEGAPQLLKTKMKKEQQRMLRGAPSEEGGEARAKQGPALPGESDHQAPKANPLLRVLKLTRRMGHSPSGSLFQKQQRPSKMDTMFRNMGSVKKS